jgi:glycosyltransferase involved in cell wall biosynthesis
MKKIGFLIGSLAGSGAEKTILTLATKLHEFGHEVHIVALKNAKDDTVFQGLKIHIATDYARNVNQGLIEISKEVGTLDLFVTSRAEHYRALNAKQLYCSVHITPTAWLKKRSFLFRWKTDVQKWKLKKKFADKNLIALSEGIKNDLVENLAVQPKRVKVINNSFEIDQIKKNATESFEEAELLGDYLVYVAALIPRKRHVDLLNAFSQLSRKDIKLVLVGKGRLKFQLEKLAYDLDIIDRIVFWPWDPNPYRLIKHAKISVLVSEAEGLPRVLIESIIIGTPVVSTDCPSGPSEVLIGQNSDYLVPVGDVKQLCLVLDKVLETNPKQHFSFKRFDALTVARIYEGLMDG